MACAANRMAFASPSRLSRLTISSATQQIRNDFWHKTSQAPPRRRTRLIDGNQLQLLGGTLDRSEFLSQSSSAGQLVPENGTPVPLGHHLVYFTPSVHTRELGADGIDIDYTPASPFSRRVWTGGRISWQANNLLRIGDTATETSRLTSAEAKTTRSGEEMIVVALENAIHNSRGLCLTHCTNWVFRQSQLSVTAPETQLPSRALALPAATPGTTFTRDFIQTPESLFRFSALTFNAHKLHYSESWCREQEGHRTIVVQGQLNLVNMLDMWRDTYAGKLPERVPRSINYHALAPFYVAEAYRGMLEPTASGSRIRLWGSDGNGSYQVGMMGDVES